MKKKKRGCTPAQLAGLEKARAAKAGKPPTAKQLAAGRIGPQSPKGKAASSRNNWRHGRYSRANDLTWQEVGMVFGRPCKSTCTRYPCSLVEDGTTKPGGNCLDKTVYVMAFDAVMAAMDRGEMNLVHGMMAAQLANAMEVLQQLRDELAANGVTIKRPVTNREGEVVGHDRILNPAMPQFIKLLGEMGISLPEMMATPRAQERAEERETAQGVVDALMERIARVPGAGARDVTDVEEEV